MKLLVLRGETSIKKCKKSRGSGTDTLNYLCEKEERTKFQDGRTWVKKAKVQKTSSPTTGGRKAGAREDETN